MKKDDLLRRSDVIEAFENLERDLAEKNALVSFTEIYGTIQCMPEYKPSVRTAESQAKAKKIFELLNDLVTEEDVQ